MSSEFTSNEPELAVRTDEYDSHEDSNQNDDLKREVSKDVFTTEAEAVARAEEIGCTGTHSHDDDGNTVYMPCGSHADYTRLTGEELENEESGYGYGGRMKKPKKPKK